MTYDWNKMVDITVPTGTNGWVYSGEVIINGVKVKFPVGTPTNVPEPAAVLLAKMIELEKEDDLNTAKPNNHYIGDVTIPEGKTLTIMKGAKVVDEDGALGGSSAPVVILPETVFPKLDDGFYADEGHVGLEELAIYPEIGKRYDVTVNGGTVTLPATAADAYDLQDACNIVLYDGSNPFAIGIAFPEKVEANGGVVSIMAFDESWNPDSVTLSIVLKEDNASSGGNAGGGVALVKVSCETTDMQTFTNITASKTYDELKAAYDADGLLWCRLTITMGEDGTASAECPLSGAQHDGDIKLFQFAPLGPLSNMGIVVYLNGDGSLKVGVN